LSEFNHLRRSSQPFDYPAFAILLTTVSLYETSRNLWSREQLEKAFSVIPAKAGIQSFYSVLDSRLRGSDDRDGFLRSRQVSYSIKLAASAASG